MSVIILAFAASLTFLQTPLIAEEMTIKEMPAGVLVTDNKDPHQIVIVAINEGVDNEEVMDSDESTLEDGVGEEDDPSHRVS